MKVDGSKKGDAWSSDDAAEADGYGAWLEWSAKAAAGLLLVGCRPRVGGVGARVLMVG
jgi:hypothetical protein